MKIEITYSEFKPTYDFNLKFNVLKEVYKCYNGFAHVIISESNMWNMPFKPSGIIISPKNIPQYINNSISRYISSVEFKNLEHEKY